MGKGKKVDQLEILWYGGRQNGELPRLYFASLCSRIGVAETGIWEIAVGKDNKSQQKLGSCSQRTRKKTAESHTSLIT